MNNLTSKVDKFAKYGQYKADLFNKLDYCFIGGKKILDLGCGDGSDSEIFINEYNLETYGIDTYKNDRIKKYKKINFKIGNIYEIPYKNQYFDYVFLHDVLHHIDEKHQKMNKHIAGLKEIKRVCKKNGTIIIIEGNRYNPLFYPHMVKMMGHNHFKQSYFKNIVLKVFPGANFEYFEAHCYPKQFLFFWKVYEYIMEKYAPKALLSYNVAIITKNIK